MSGHAFKVGDIVVLLWAKQERYQKFVGCDYEIIGPLELKRDSKTGDYMGYDVRRPDGSKGYVRHDQVRLRRPPSWDKWIFDTSDVDQERPIAVMP